MTTTPLVDSPPRVWTVSTILAEFGDLPLARVWTAPPPGTATPSDVERLVESENRLCELIDGVLVEKTMGWKESGIAGWILTILNNFVIPRKLGKVLGADGLLLLEEGQVRIPDVAFISTERFQGRALPSGAFWTLGCDLAVEVLSPGNTEREMERKLADYFTDGVQRVWIVDPQARTVTVHRSPSDLSVLSVADTLEGEPLLPGFSIPVAQIFATTE